MPPGELSVGDILEPISDAASLPPGSYQVVKLENDDVLVARLFRNEDGNPATTGRTSWIGQSERGMYRILRNGATDGPI